MIGSRFIRVAKIRKVTNFLRALCVFRCVLREPHDCAGKRFTKNTTDTKKYTFKIKSTHFVTLM